MEKEVYIDLLCELIQMKPESHDIEAVNKVQNRVREFLSERGVFCVMEKCGERDVLFASTTPGKVQDLLLCVHLDVVPAENEKQYAPVISEGIVYGRGSSDCLGNAVTAIKALCTAPSGASVGCIFTGDEEIGGLTTEYMVKQGYASRRLSLILDAGGCVYYSQKGIINLKLTAYGNGGHASQPWSFNNPITSLTKGLAKLFEAWENPANAHDWRLSIAPTILRAGNAANRIPDCAEAILNIRFIKLEEREQICQFIRETTGLEAEIIETCDPFTSPVDGEDVAKVIAAYEKAFDRKITPGRMCGATDARHLYKIGTPVYISGIDGSGAHSADEKLQLASIDKGVAMVMELLDI